MHGITTSSLIQSSTFYFDGREINATIDFILRDGHPDADVHIIDKKLNKEFLNDVISYRWFRNQVLVKPQTSDQRLQGVIDAIAEMLLNEYPGNIQKIV